MQKNRFSSHGVAHATALFCTLCMAAPGAHAADACYVDAAGANPAGCMAGSTFSGSGEFEPSIIRVMAGGQYTTPAGLFILNGNTALPGGNTGTRGIYAHGQSADAVPVPSRATVAAYAPITINVTNVSNPTANEAVYAVNGAQILFHGALNAITKTAAAGQQAIALRADDAGVGAMAGTPSRITVEGRLDVDTTQAATTPFAIRAAGGGEIKVQAGGTIQSAASGIYVLSTGLDAYGSTFFSSGATALALQTAGNGITIEGQNGGNPNWGTVQLNNAAITAHDSGVRLYSSNDASSHISYRQQSGSITSTNGSAIAFSGGAGGQAVATLINTTVATTAPAMGGADADGVARGYAVLSTSNAANTLDMTGGSITGHIVTDGGASLWLAADGTQWNTAGNPAAANANVLTGISGTATIAMNDINDVITLNGNAPALGPGCGAANITLVVPAQPAPAASPHTVMVCNNAATAPAMALQGGSVVLGGYFYTLLTTPGGGQVIYSLVRGAAAPPLPGGGTNSVPTLSQWGLLLLTALLGFAATRRRTAPTQNGH